MANKMSVEKAVEIAEAITSATLKWGKHARVNFTEFEIYEAVTTLNTAREGAGQVVELTKLRRQLAACQNREKGRLARIERPEDGEEVT